VLNATYLTVFARSFWYGALTTALSVLAGYPVGWAIARAPRKWQSTLLVLVTVPFFTSFLVRAYAWMTVLKADGLVNSLLLAFSLIDEPVELLYSPAAVVVGLVYAYVPFVILPVYGAAEKLDYSLVEAALDLGASPFAAFRRVILPLTMPGLLSGALLVFVPSIGMFAVTDLLGGSRVVLIGNVIQNQFGQARNWPLGAALSTALLLAFCATYALVASRPGHEGVD
jgi:spermidine/putrescine transport system permease protein